MGADGVKSHVRHVTGLQSMNWNYNQSAVIATLTLEQVILTLVHVYDYV